MASRSLVRPHRHSVSNVTRDERQSGRSNRDVAFAQTCGVRKSDRFNAMDGYTLYVAIITPEDARAYANRWALMEAFELEELRRTPMATKLLKLASLMASRNLFAPDPERESGVLDVRNRWARLREVLE